AEVVEDGFGRRGQRNAVVGGRISRSVGGGAREDGASAGALSVLRCTGSDGHADALIALDGHLPAEVELGGDIGGRGPYLGRLVVAEEKGQGKHGKGANHGDDNRQLGQAEAALPSPVTAPGTSDSHGPPGDVHARESE